MQTQSGKIYRRSAGSPLVRPDAEKEKPFSGPTEPDRTPAENAARHTGEK